jgi:phosphoribosyl 1,2-cyclic phosphate phosphodiesterase
MEKIRGTKILVLNALQLNHHISHFTLDEAIEMVEMLQPERAYFTHISHKLGTHAEVEASLPSNIRLAYDGLKITI